MSVTSGRTYLLFAVTTFLSAFLLFQIQPIAGKVLLPWFGGSSSVWATSMLFFTGMLFFGYLYVYILTQRSVRTQACVHMSLIGLGIFTSLSSLILWDGIFPSLEWTIENSTSPALKTLIVLLSGLAIPYFLLTTTSPLLQYWYGLSTTKEPYKLYALSNVGSLFALASYPFLFEPFMRLPEQEMLWNILFLMLSALLGTVSWRVVAGVKHASTHEHVPVTRKLLWIAYAALPAFLLVATTTEITQTIAPLPLLWIVPLSLYLLSFVIAFAGFRLITNAGGAFSLSLLILTSAFAGWWYIDATAYTIKWKILADMAVLFFLALHAHSHLYRLRPTATQSPLFYCYLSFGGMLGTLLASVVAPIVFNDYYEFALGLALAAAAALHISPFPRFSAKWHRAMYFLKIASVSFVLTLIASASYFYFKDRNEEYVLSSRNFYGTVKVYSRDDIRGLLHGSTLHGMQVMTPEEEFIPTAYYTPESGIGRAFMYTRLANPDQAASVAILGLGAGMTAAYCVPGDRFVYYEIDPRIEGIARQYFTYLSHCPQAEIRNGDGRILLDQESRSGMKGEYDLIFADAFNDDTIPVHLITREAIQRYVSHLRNETGIVGVHISNRYLDLLPVLMSIAREEGLSLLNVEVQEGPGYISASHWVLLSPSPDTFNAEIFKNAASPLSKKEVPAWTDDASNLISVLEIP